MTELIVHCDACGVRITDGRSRLVVESGPLRTWTPSIDLCETCSSRLRDQLDALRTSVPCEIEGDR